MGITPTLGLGYFCFFLDMKAATIVRTVMSKEITRTLTIEDFSLSDRYSSLKLYELTVKA